MQSKGIGDICHYVGAEFGSTLVVVIEYCQDFVFLKKNSIMHVEIGISVWGQMCFQLVCESAATGRVLLLLEPSKGRVLWSLGRDTN
ncbi:hypothetical protein DSO57_1035260 [Entomophthora muscae]|uniref:Uncharacterized protein n=1 Tax=Entomophthora muscae TaxID=34485 RepID=A0ACC2SZK0_9FUNG|nr:hypothetical protein DSO57_1035260 [Entomophthora muscae]